MSTPTHKIKCLGKYGRNGSAGFKQKPCNIAVCRQFLDSNYLKKGTPIIKSYHKQTLIAVDFQQLQLYILPIFRKK
jgi:hypothetical protein